MGCLSRIGCLVVLAGAGGVGWWLYGDQLPSTLSHAASRVAGSVRSATGVATPGVSVLDSVRSPAGTAGTSDGLAWATVPTAATGLSDPLAPLSQKNGPAFVSLGAGDLATVMSRSLIRQLPPSASNMRIAIDGNLLLARAAIDVTEIAGDGTLGRMLGIALTGRDTIGFGGSVTLIRPGTAEYQVSFLRVKGFDVPPRLIPMYMRALRRGTREEGLADEGFAITLPASIADLRLTNGKMTLYKAVPTP